MMLTLIFPVLIIIAINVVLINARVLRIIGGGKTMSESERLKQAEPMAVVSFPMPETCEQCPLLLVGIDGDEYLCAKTGKVLYLDERTWDELPDHCEIRAAIGIIEPTGQITYLREEEK